MRNILCLAALASWAAPCAAQFGSATVRVDAARVMNRISPWMYGSCIEDVNHEIYGGLYAQRIFGESFEEPPGGSPLVGWTPYGGAWRVSDGSLRVGANAGAKLVKGGTTFGDGAVECEIRFPDTQGGNAGLILRVNEPRTGADSWIGYEVSLSAHDKTIHVSRHRNNWVPLKTVPAPVEPGKWLRLRAELDGPRIRVHLDGEGPFVDLVDPEPLPPGLVGVRTWNSDAAYRNLAIITPSGHIEESLSKGVESAQVSGLWDPIRTGSARTAFGWSDKSPYNGARIQTITHAGGSGMVGVANRGLNRWGIPLDRPMRGALYVRSTDYHGPITVSLLSMDGSRTFAARKIKLPKADGTWQRVEFHLPQPPPSQGGGHGSSDKFPRLPNGSPGRIRPSGYAACQTPPGAKKELLDPGSPLFAKEGESSRRALAAERTAPRGGGALGRFAITIDSPGTVDVDQVTLVDSRDGLFRKDIQQKLVEQGLTFLRYGGSMVNAPEYRWKKMNGDRDRRPPYRGTWYPYSTNGFGIEEFLRFCEASRITPAFAVNIWESPEDMADMVEYLNGPVTSKWGRERAKAGHPKPYGVRYIEIGNEEAIDGNKKWYADYLERFKLLEPAMHAKDPGLQLVIAAWWRPEEPLVKQIAQELRDKAALWDVHVGGDDLRDGANVDRTFTEMERLFGEWIPGSNLKAAVFEENGDRHDLQRALGHAYILNVTQRHGDFVRMDCPANCLQPLGQNDNGWNQGQVFFTPTQVWGMPPFYAQQMAAENHEPLRVDSQMVGGGLDVTATRSEDGRTLVLKVVNTSGADKQARFEVAGFPHPKSKVETWTLAGELTAVNTPDEPERIGWKKSGFLGAAEKFGYTFTPQSYTILRLTR